MPNRTTILAFDTSAAHCAAAFMSEGCILAEAREEMVRGQAERLMPMLGEVMAAAGADWPDLDLVAVGTGPGNFTGLRVSVAAARGLALGLGRPAMGISAFELALGDKTGGAVLVCLPAPRDMAYVQPFRRGRPADPARMIDPDRPPRDLQASGGMAVAGPLADRVGRHFECVVDGWADGPVAPRIARIARRRWAQGDTAPERPAPLYVRPPDAAPARPAPPVG